jgi:hypothetical protein
VPAAKESSSVVWRPGEEKRHWRTVREEWGKGGTIQEEIGGFGRREKEK